jgi:hypothetical protein
VELITAARRTSLQVCDITTIPINQRFSKGYGEQAFLTWAYINPSCLSLFKRLGAAKKLHSAITCINCGRRVTDSSETIMTQHFG